MSDLIWNRATRKLNAASINIRPAINRARRHVGDFCAEIAKLLRSPFEPRRMAALAAGIRKIFVALGTAVAEKRRRVRESLGARENELKRLLASSLEAIVVTDGEHRVVAANPKALDLLGVSNTNVKKFTIDTFVSEHQFAVFDGSAWPLIRREERYGTCAIRRLDGSIRYMEFVFVPNFLPLRNVCRFRVLGRRPPI